MAGKKTVREQTPERFRLPQSDYSTCPPCLEICPLPAWLPLLPPGTSQKTVNLREARKSCGDNGNCSMSNCGSSKNILREGSQLSSAREDSRQDIWLLHIPCRCLEDITVHCCAQLSVGFVPVASCDAERCLLSPWPVAAPMKSPGRTRCWLCCLPTGRTSATSW